MLWVFYIIHQLRSIERAILKMTESFYRMKEGCKPRTFYNCIRPFLAGSNGNPSVPAGVIYDGCYGNTHKNITVEVPHSQPYFQFWMPYSLLVTKIYQAQILS